MAITISMLKILKELFVFYSLNPVDINQLNKRRRRRRKQNLAYITLIMRRTKYSYLHIYETVKKMAELGLVIIKKEGSRSVILLTPKGMEIGKLSYLLFKKLDNLNDGDNNNNYEDDIDDVVGREV